MSNDQLDMIIDWCREKIVCTKRMHRMNSKTFDGYETAMKAVMSYLHSLKKANNEQIQATTSEIIELANIIAERPCDSKDCAPCIRMGRRCNDYLKAEKMIKAGYRKCSENVIELPCKVGDLVHFKGLETPWKVSAIHIYQEGQPQISITSETGKMTSTMTANEFYAFCFVVADERSLM